MKTVYLILGSIGSGKSVVADYILSNKVFENIEYVGSDIYKKKYFDIDVGIDERGYRCADELVFHRIEQICKSDNDFMYEFCPTNLNKIQTIKYLTQKYNYKIISFFIGTQSKEINVERCKSREIKGADEVSEEKVIRRYSEALNRVIEIADISSKMYFIDNSLEIPKITAYLFNDELEILDSSCKWFRNNIQKKIINSKEKHYERNKKL